MRRAVEDPVLEEIVFRAPRLSGCQTRVEAVTETAEVMLPRGLLQKRARGDLREIDPAPHLGVEPGVVRRADGAIAIAVITRKGNGRVQRTGWRMAALALLAFLQGGLDVGEADGVRLRRQRALDYQR